MLNYGVEYTTDTKDLDLSKHKMLEMIDSLNQYGKGQAILRVTGIISLEPNT